MAPTNGKNDHSVRTEGGLEKLNNLLAVKSYVSGGLAPTEEDIKHFQSIHAQPDAEQFPHVARWYSHIAALRRIHSDNRAWPGPGAPVGATNGTEVVAPTSPAAASAPKKGRAAGKERVELQVDCVAEVRDENSIRIPRGIKPSGAASDSLPGVGAGCEAGKYYITTAINYCNGWAHIGHAYEALTTDAFARHHRIMGKDTFFLTGADEHGQKIAQAAEAKSKTPQQICDEYSDGFKALK